MQEGLKKLETLLDPYDWFYEVVVEARRYVVYVHSMDISQDAIIPDSMMGHQVVIHFASSAPGVKNEFVSKPQTHTLPAYNPFARTQLEIITESDVALLKELGWIPTAKEPHISDLTNKLDRLERICGSNILQDLFYECHDQRNAVTNLRARFPEVYSAIVELYKEYGFDIIYNELDG
jgi:hypothetical protein